MVDFFRQHAFLTFSLMLSVPGMVVWILRPDLRVVIRRMIVFSAPFALTEPLFYPDYWSPKFLFGLADRWGFGIEDFLFVASMAAFSSTCWAFVSHRVMMTSEKSSGVVRRVLFLFGLTVILVVGVSLAGIAMITGSCLIMLVIGVLILFFRPDLGAASLGGGLLTGLVYLVLCLLLALFIPGVFLDTWHTSKFLNIFIFGIPLEELLYALTGGFLATAFYPYVFNMRFEKAPNE